MPDIEIETSTDTVEQVKEALGAAVEIDESPAETGETETEEQPSADETTEESETGETSTEEGTTSEEEHPEEEEESGKPKKASSSVPRARLNQEIERRKEAERKLAERSKPKADEPGDEETGADKGKPPEFFSGKPEPQFEDFTKNVDELDPKAMAKAAADYAKAHGTWSRTEARAEAEYNVRVEKARERQAELTADFVDRRDAFIEQEPLYDELVTGSDVQLTNAQELFVYESEVGPQMLLYFVQHPKEAARIGSMKMRSQSAAMLDLETKLVKQYAGKGKAESEEESPRKVPPPKKTTSAAPPPPSRIKSQGPGPKSLQELAGPTDRTGIDVDFNPEFEKADRAKRSAS